MPPGARYRSAMKVSFPCRRVAARATALLILGLAVAGGMACSQRLAAQDSARPPEVIAIPKGAFVMGSTGQEKERAYKLDQTAYGHDRTRQWGWYDNEIEAQNVYLPAYRITRNLITNADYALFVKATGHRVPDVDQETGDKKDTAMEELERWNPLCSLPTVVVDQKECFVGFKPEKLTELIN